MSKSQHSKIFKKGALTSAQKQDIAIACILLLAAAYIAASLYSTLNVGLQTQTAQASTVYKTVDTTALVVRQEHIISSASGVAVSDVEDCEKVVKGGRIALTFSDAQKAAAYSQYAELEEELQYYADMEKLTDMLLSGTQWADIGLSELYGSVTVDTTDPVKSNSGNMFAALLANVLNGGNTVDEESAEKVLPDLQAIFAALGYMETSSADLFSQFLRMGIGARPIIAGYESQLLEFAAQNPEDYAAMADDVVMVYPSPTVWSTHVYIALDEAGAAGIDALLDEEIQRLAWEKHGFRTSGYGTIAEAGGGAVPGVAEEIIRVTNVPDYPAMKKIMDGL